MWFSASDRPASKRSLGRVASGANMTLSWTDPYTECGIRGKRTETNAVFRVFHSGSGQSPETLVNPREARLPSRRLMVIWTGAEVTVVPEKLVALAVSVCTPAAKVRVIENGAEVSLPNRVLPS